MVSEPSNGLTKLNVVKPWETKQMGYMKDYFPPIIKVVPALVGYDVIRDGEVVTNVKDEDRAKELAFSMVQAHKRKVGSL